MSLRDYISAKAVPLCAAGIGGLYLVLVSCFCGIPFSLLLILLFQNPFADVDQESYYGEAVMWALANSITNGTSTTTFSPSADCTRAQIVTFLYHYLGK